MMTLVVYYICQLGKGERGYTTAMLVERFIVLVVVKDIVDELF